LIDGRQREASTIKGKRSRRPSKTSFFSPLSPPSPPPPKKKQGDFHHWAPFFNRLDEFYESALTKRAEIRLVAEDGDDSDDDDAAGEGGDGSKPPLLSSPPLPERALVAAMRASAIVLEHCSNKHLFSSYDRLSTALAAGDSPAVVDAALACIAAFVRKTHSSAVRWHGAAPLNSRLLALAMAAGGEGRAPCSLTDLVSSSEAAAREPPPPSSPPSSSSSSADSSSPAFEAAGGSAVAGRLFFQFYSTAQDDAKRKKRLEEKRRTEGSGAATEEAPAPSADANAAAAAAAADAAAPSSSPGLKTIAATAAEVLSHPSEAAAVAALVEVHGVPRRDRFKLLARVRAARWSSALASRREAAAQRLLSFSLLLQSSTSPSSEALVPFFQDSPDFVGELAAVLRRSAISG